LHANEILRNAVPIPSPKSTVSAIARNIGFHCYASIKLLVCQAVNTLDHGVRSSKKKGSLFDSHGNIHRHAIHRYGGT
jgi:hypothetical protein